MRPINADALKEWVENVTESEWGWQEMLDKIDAEPTIDAEPVTRCRDCKHRQAKMGDCYGNFIVLCKDGLWRDMEFFCADGERSEE